MEKASSSGSSFLPCRTKRTFFSFHTLVWILLWFHRNSVFHPEHLYVLKPGSGFITVKATRRSWITCIIYFLVNGTLRSIFLPKLPAVLLTETLVAVSANSSVTGSRVNVKTLPHAKGRLLRSISQCHSPPTSSHAWWQSD